MWLINSITPDHGTIAGFVQKNKAAFHNTLRNLTLILKGWGLIDGKLVAIDGTKIKAQNSKHNCITQSGLDKKIEYAEAQINAYLMAMEKEDIVDDSFKEKLQAYQALKEQYFVQKQERTTQPKMTNSVKKSSCMTKNKIYTFVQLVINCLFLKTPPRME